MYPRSTPYENQPALRENIITVAMPGVTSSRAQLARYVGEEGLTVLENWSSDEGLRQVDGNGNRHRRRARLRMFWRAAKAIFRPKRTIFSEGDPPLPPEEGEADAKDSKKDDGQGPADGDRDSQRHLSPEAAAAEAGQVDPPPLFHARCRIGPRLLHNVMPSPEVVEMVHVRRGRGWPGWRAILQPAHLLLTLKEVFMCLWFAVRPISVCYSEVGRTNLAGVRDQESFTREVRRAVHHIERDKAEAAVAAVAGKDDDGSADSGAGRRKHLVLFGCSRGAATCFYAAMKLPKELAVHVSLVVLEAPFDTLEHVIESSSIFPNLNMWFFKSFCDYRGKLEESAAYHYDPAAVQLRCPVAFVVSQRDTRVPMECTQVLIDGLRERLVPHVIPAVEVLVLRHSRHPCMPVANREDQDAYVAFMERLYDTYCT